MNTPISRRLLALLALATLAPVCGFAADPVTVSGGVTLTALRHADRDPNEPQLNAAGVARAAALPAALEGQAIDAIFGPEIARNWDTVLPLGAARGLEYQAVATYSMPDILADTAAGQTLVWVGNKGNLKRLWLRISAPGEPPLNYGDLFIVKIHDNNIPEVARGHFGE